MRLLVLGSAAGGGYPQWNCLCAVCRLAWNGDPRVEQRSQSSIAASADGRHWLLLNASPDLRGQIVASPTLGAGARGKDGESRASPISAVLVTNGDVDHVAGLLTLREKQRFDLYGTRGVLDVLQANPVFSVLDPAVVALRPIRAGEVAEPVEGLEIEIFAVPGKVPLYLEAGEVEIGAEGEMTVGVRLSAGGRTAFYIPGCASVPDHLRERVRGADVLLFDGTVFHDDEMSEAGVGVKTGRRMGHLPIAGDGGSLHAFDDLGIGQRIYIHINNTNPILVEGSVERQAVEAAGWRVASDGREIEP
ncbi:pyrroloquinoline quinone biosynthesis protein PqqB [Aureimonas sp. Leaf454]|uniref:pyrroloquinoline quinone biosynthesis protein PqqB n=1 Tax=Aureimonas sp. Leaf454 TaxID=1736381 RepID=UPI0006F3C03A|nr:pyrroloquinoline quinone biosynthesis protein PqqB [Aureimonas sp. Leaf454]KQT45291.1 pyrroloquinoline quinone biosynthesis protein PqqB [Aureimonas sp. Leaf454]